MNILEKIETLRKDKTPNEIEITILNEELGEIGVRPDGYQCVEYFTLSHLVVEVHNPGFIRWMRKYPNAKVVHHIDGNPSNNAYINLRVMKRGNHTRLHQTDPRFAETEKARCKAMSKWFTDPANAETVKARSKALSKAKIAYFADPLNTKAIKTVAKAVSETKRKNWIDLSNFKKFFMIGEYAETSKVSVSTAYYRLAILLNEGQITYEKKSIGGHSCNVYRRITT